MMMVLKGFRWGYYLSSIIGALGIIAVTNFINPNPPGLLIACLAPIIWIIACVLFFSVAANKYYQNKIVILYDNCRIRDYIEKNEKFLSKNRNKSSVRFFKLNLFAGYFALGETERAAQLLFQIQPNFGTKFNGITNAAVYYNDLAAYFIRTCDFERAKQAIDSMRALLDSTKINNVYRHSIVNLIEIKSMMLDTRQGRYDGAKKFFEMRLSTAKTLHEKVSISFSLADICIHFGENDEAKQHIQFVIENGGDTCYVTEAKKLMQANTIEHDR